MEVKKKKRGEDVLMMGYTCVVDKMQEKKKRKRMEERKGKE